MTQTPRSAETDPNRTSSPQHQGPSPLWTHALWIVPALAFFAAGVWKFLQDDMTKLDQQQAITLLVGGPLLCWLTQRIIRRVLSMRRRLQADAAARARQS